jgi:DNA-binding XRE family transcriptional regulator
MSSSVAVKRMGNASTKRRLRIISGGKGRKGAFNKGEWAQNRTELFKEAVQKAAAAKAIRIAFNITQYEMSRFLGYGKQAVAYWESGRYFGWTTESLAQWTRDCERYVKTHAPKFKKRTA